MHQIILHIGSTILLDMVELESPTLHLQCFVRFLYMHWIHVVKKYDVRRYQLLYEFPMSNVNEWNPFL